MESTGIDSGEKASILLESLICYLREKNVLSRADLETLLDQVEKGHACEGKALRSDEAAVAAAARDMAAIERYCGLRFGGKHRR